MVSLGYCEGMGDMVIIQRSYKKTDKQNDWRTCVRALQDCQQRGYHVARMILSDSSRAEDAVQDANEKAIVKLRSGFVPEDLNKWFVVLVLNAARNQYRSEHRRKRREEYHATDRQAAAANLPEVHRELAEALAQLAEEERLPISLHYAMGYSQKEVSRFLEISERTVSYRIGNGLKRLRALLTANGRPLVPAVLINLLEEQTSLPMPPGLERDAQELFARAAEDDSLVPAEGSSSRAGGSTPLFLMVAFTAALSAGVILGWPKNKPESEPLASSKTESDPSPRGESEKAPPWQDRRWTFENGLGKDLKVLLGNVQRVPASNGRRASILAPNSDGAVVKKPLILMIDVPLSSESIYLKLHARAVKGVDWVHITTRLVREKIFLPYREPDLGHLTLNKHELVFRVCIFGRYLIEVLGDRINRISKFDRRNGTERIAIMVANYHIEEIVLKNWPRHQFPDKLQDPEALLKKLKELTQKRPDRWIDFPEYAVPTSPQWTERHARHLIKNKDVPLSQVARPSE